MLFGKSYDDVNRFLDNIPKHRKTTHNIFAPIVVGILKKDAKVVVVAYTHVLTDLLWSVVWKSKKAKAQQG